RNSEDSLWAKKGSQLRNLISLLSLVVLQQCRPLKDSAPPCPILVVMLASQSGNRPPGSEWNSILHERRDSRMLELAADLGFFDEPAHQFGLVLVFLQQHLDSQRSSQVGVAAFENRPHAAVGDFAEELVAIAALFGRGHRLGRA